MNNRETIREKQNLQNEFSASIAGTNKRILSWLGPIKNENGNANTADLKAAAENDFFSLPIIGSGAGLSLGKEGSSLSINTIDDHIKHRKTIKVRKDSTKYDSMNSSQQKLLQAETGDSTSIKSLKNKLRKDNVKKLRDNNHTSNPLVARSRKSMPTNDNTDDSDSERELRDQRSAKKKKTNVLFGAKVKKRK